jgi:glycosyltransferase involved in cell wall biosynthesis
MSIAQSTRLAPGEELEPAVVEIVVPVFNEERILAASIRRLRHYLNSEFPLGASVVIVDNGSADGTWPLAQDLSAELDGVRALRTTTQGRGHALRTAWSASSAAVVAYMDVDLSTGLDALFPLVAPLLSGHSDVAIGTRLAPGARVTRSMRREVISRGYNLVLRTALRTRVSDAQCGFKALRAEVARLLVPMVEDDAWFFDTELLVLAERHGLRIHEVAVDWIEDPDSRVKIAATVWADLKGIGRLHRHRGAATSAGRSLHVITPAASRGGAGPR